jgi:hypothetical protein
MLLSLASVVKGNLCGFLASEFSLWSKISIELRMREGKVRWGEDREREGGREGWAYFALLLLCHERVLIDLLRDWLIGILEHTNQGPYKASQRAGKRNGRCLPAKPLSKSVKKVWETPLAPPRPVLPMR